MLTLVLCSNLFQPSHAQLFGHNIAISNSQNSSEPEISSYGNNVYVVWRDETTGNGDIYFRKSANYGNDFTPTLILGKNIGISSQPKVSSNGNYVYVVWRDETTGKGDIYFKRSTDNGASFEKRGYLYKSNASSSEPQIASDGNNVYVVWRDETTGKGDIYFRKSANFGKSFGQTIQLSKGNGSSSEPQIASDGNNVYVVWRDETTGKGDIYFRASEDSGHLFRGIKNLAATKESSSEPKISLDGSNVYVVWRDETTNNGDVYFRKGTNYGKEFDDIEKLSRVDDSSSEPQMSVYQNNLYVLWTESNFNNTKIFFDSSRNFGSDFYNSVDLSANLTLSYDPRLDISNGNIYVVWRDGDRIDDTDIYFKRINEEFNSNT